MCQNLQSCSAFHFETQTGICALGSSAHLVLPTTLMDPVIPISYKSGSGPNGKLLLRIWMIEPNQKKFSL
jgi:hypothetical protein